MNTLNFKALFLVLVTGEALLSVVAADDYEAIEGGPFIEPPKSGAGDNHRAIEGGPFIEPPTSGVGDDYRTIEGGPFIEPPISGGWVDYSDALLPRMPHAESTHVEATLPGDDKEILKCARMVNGNCGKEIFEYVFAGGDYPGFNCCNGLVSMGKSCHDILTGNVITKVPALGNLIKKDHKDEQVWSYCLEKA